MNPASSLAPTGPWLASAGPHPDLPAEQRLFGPFIGSWDLVVRWHENGRVVRRERGEWHFAWVLEGRAVQDVCIVPPRSERAGHADPYEYGTSVRFPDEDAGGWRSIWIGPTRKATHRFLARKADRAVLLDTRREDGRRMRWMFSDVAQNSFAWRNLLETDDGWRLTQDFAASRVGPPPASA